ncbi:MAG: hypothetical protein U0Q16_37875 [Bryobacteraceae bacterium]
MTTVERETAINLLERMDGEQLMAAVRFMQFLLLDPVARAAATAPIDDEPVSEAERARIRETHAFIKSGGEGIPMEEVLADFGLTLADFPLTK